jgi:hypothetical protein
VTHTSSLEYVASTRKESVNQYRERKKRDPIIPVRVGVPASAGCRACSPCVGLPANPDHGGLLPIRLKPVLQRKSIAVRSNPVPCTQSPLYMPTTYGDFQPQNVHAHFKNSGKSTESTFASHSAKNRLFRGLSKTLSPQSQLLSHRKCVFQIKLRFFTTAPNSNDHVPKQL